MLRSIADAHPFTNEAGKVIAELFGNATTGHLELSLALITLPPQTANHPERNEFIEVLIPVEGQGFISVDGSVTEISSGLCELVPPNATFIVSNNSADRSFVYWSFCVPGFRPQLSNRVVQ